MASDTFPASSAFAPVSLLVFLALIGVMIWARRRDERKKAQGTFRPFPRWGYLVVILVFLVGGVLYFVLTR